VVQCLPPNKLVFTLGIFTSVPILVKIHQEMRAWESTRTETNWFYNLSVLLYSEAVN